MADRRKALAGAAFFGFAVPTPAQFRAPDILTIFADAGLTVWPGQVSAAGSRLLAHPLFGYPGEINCRVYMVSFPNSLLFLNIVARVSISAASNCPVWRGFALFSRRAQWTLHRIICSVDLLATA